MMIQRQHLSRLQPQEPTFRTAGFDDFPIYIFTNCFVKAAQAFHRSRDVFNVYRLKQGAPTSEDRHEGEDFGEFCESLRDVAVSLNISFTNLAQDLPQRTHRQARI